MEPPWSELFGATAKLTAAAFLFAYLLYLGGVRPGAAALITAAHVQFLLCICPLSAEVIFSGLLILGTCTYAVLVVDRPRSRAFIVVACFLALVLPVLTVSSAGSLVLGTALGLWAGFMVSIRDWARQKKVEVSEAK
jgi:hypothetical protein